MPSPIVSNGIDFWIALGFLALGVFFVKVLLEGMQEPWDWGGFIGVSMLAVACFWVSGDLVGKIVGWLTRTLGN